MPIYTDPTLYSSVPSYALYLSNPYSSHSSLLNSYSRPSFTKPLPRFHRGFNPHLATITENPAAALLRRKYSPQLNALHNSSKYKAPRPIQINTADIDVSANKYRPHRTEVSKSPEKPVIRKSPTKEETPPSEPISKPIRRDRATVRLHTFHSGDSNKNKKWRQNFNSRELATEEVKPKEPEEGKISRNSSFHDICRAISQDSINEALNPGQPEEITKKQGRSFSTEDIIKQIRRNSADILKENIEALDILLNQEDVNNNQKADLPKKKIKKKDDNFEPRGSIKRKKKVMKKKSGDIEQIDDNPPNQKRNTNKKIKSTSSDTSLATEVNEELPIVDTIKDISNVHVEQIRAKPKPIITSTVDVEETKSNLKFVVDDVMVEESLKPKPQKKFKFNVTVQVEEKKPKLDKKKIERKGRVCIPRSKDLIVTDVKKTEHRGSLGDICEEELPKKVKKVKQLKSVDTEVTVCIPKTKGVVLTDIKKTEQRGSLGDICEGLEDLPKKVKKLKEDDTKESTLPSKEQSKSCSDLKPKEELQKSIMKTKTTDQNKALKKSVSIDETPITKSKSAVQLTLKDSPKTWLTKETKPKDVIVPGLRPKNENPSMDFWDALGNRGSVYEKPSKPLVLNIPPRDEEVCDDAQEEKSDEPKEDNKEESVQEVEIVDKKSEEGKPEEVNEGDSDKPKKLSNRLSQWMHPFKKPEQYDECPVEIFATPKTIRKRHYPRPRHPPPPQESGSDDSDEESEDSDEEEESSDEEGNVGKSTSSNDSGFNSSNGRGENRKNKDCDVNIHRKCEKLTANLCGINQKMIVEAIESVKKGSTDTRDSPTANPAHNPAFSLDACDQVEDFQTSSTYVGFQKSGRITPPATTIPRFRKYSIDDFNFLKVLGKGSFGKVLLAELKDTEYYYAIKCLKKDVVLEDDDVECTLIERKVLALGTKHPYLCHLLCTFQTESHLFFVMEYLNGGDLMFHIQQSGRFPEHRARFYGAEIVSGLKFLHGKGIVYRDLKLDNILLDFDGHVRIADFGMCKLQIFLDRTADTFCGTPDYMAPEIIKGQHYNQCVDWWSFGVLLYEMLIGQSPFSGCDEDELFWSICNEKPVLPRFLSPEANLILTNLLEKDAAKRLGYKLSPHGDIQDHQFFRSIAWDLLEKRQLEAPFKPDLQHPLDTQYFDRTFTVEKAKLTPIENNILQSMDQTQFQGFSYTNPNATDR